MRIITHPCTNCGTVISANELESNRVMKCPRVGCDEILRFADLPEEEQKYFVENLERYQI